MSAPVPVAATPAVPAHEEIAALSGAVREGDLTPAQAERLVWLLERLGSGVRRHAVVCAEQSGDRRWRQREVHAAAMWNAVAQAYLELLAEVPR